MNRETAGKQTDREKKRDTENVLWHGARQTLADIEEVRHHKDCEDRSLGGDQAEHPDLPASGTITLKCLFRYRHRNRIHRIFPTIRTSSLDRPRASDPRAGGGSGRSGWYRSWIQGAANSLSIRVSRHPTDRFQ